MKEPFLEPILRRLRLQKVISHIPQGSSVLDIGCGKTATFLKTISSRVAYGYGVDFKIEENVQLTQNITLVNLKLDNRLPFPDSTFNVVTMLAVLEHIEKEEEILSEIYRVLVPGGKLVLTVPSIWAQPVLEFLAYKLKIVSEAEIRDHKRYYTRASLQKVLVEKSGFTDFNHYYFQTWMNNFCKVLK